MCKISVIIPVYNVERYLEKCVNSILRQTFTDYEVILVDDGSTDNSNKLCDILAQKSKKIKVYHKSNGGLSDARNFGVNKSSGKYITFIDSDDYIRCDYLELLYNAIVNEVADISVVLPEVVYENTDFNIINNKSSDNIYDVFSGKELLKFALMGKKGSLSAWAKLYKREYVLGYPFPIGELYEDMEVLYNIYLSAHKIVVVNQKAYFYLRRQNSIVNSKITDKHLYGLKSCINMLNTNNEKNKQLDKYIKCRIVMQACGHIPNIVTYKDKEMFDKIYNISIKYIKGIIFQKEVPFKLKLRSITYLLGDKIGLHYAKCFLNIKKLLIYNKK